MQNLFSEVVGGAFEGVVTKRRYQLTVLGVSRGGFEGQNEFGSVFCSES